MLLFVLSGCAHTEASVALRHDGEAETLSSASARASRSTSTGRTQTVGLPLSRAGKIGLWAGVAVFLAYLMQSDGDEDGEGSTGP